MHVSAHTHKADNPSITTEFNNKTDWNPWIEFEFKNGNVVADRFIIHIGELSIEEGYAFIDSWDEAGHAIREWVNYRSTVENMDVES